MTRRGIAAVLPPEVEDEEDADGPEAAEEAAEQDESDVTDDEEPVSAAAGDVPAGDERR
jgi:hypothetical protein